MQLNPDQLQQVRAAFFLGGQSIADWARVHRFRQDLVYAVLSGRSKATRGESHRIAVMLGLKAQLHTIPSTEVEKNM